MRKLAHPVAAFIIAVCCVIGTGVGVLAATGNGGLSLALTCAQPSAHVLGPPGARFTVAFPGSVVLIPPFGYAVDVAPSNEFCTYSAKPPKDSPLTFAVVAVNGYPHYPHILKPGRGFTDVRVGTDSGQLTIRCFPKGGGCLGLMVLTNRQYQWYVTGQGTNAGVVRSFFRSFHPIS